MFMLRVCAVRSATKAGVVDADKMFVSKIPFTGSDKVNGIPKVAPDEKFKETLKVAGSAITGTHQVIYQLR
jgi:hypothetical protein